MTLYVGLMSGTSADGVEAALVDIAPDGTLAFYHGCTQAYPDTLRQRILALSRGDYQGEDAIDALGALDRLLGEAFADAALHVIRQAHRKPEHITAIASHGQTIRHRPHAGFTLQIADPNIIAARTAITTVADFRRRDMAFNGQGAPLTPAFHQAIFAHPDEARAVVNLGGIANLTCLTPGRTVHGFDTGPANTLLDAWATRHGHGPIDRDGAWARTGHLNDTLLAQLLAEPFFTQPPPKSTGPETFNLDWLDLQLAAHPQTLSAADVQATLVALTARSIAQAVIHTAPATTTLFVCGGGVHNSALMAAINDALPRVDVRSTAALKVDPDYLEAMAFAWLAHESLNHRPANLPAVTGASQATVLGGVYACATAQNHHNQP